MTLPPHLVADLGVGRDRVATGGERISETDETRLLVGVARGLIRTAGGDLVETDMLRLPNWQRELEALTTPSFDGLRWRRSPVDDDPAHTARLDEPFWWIVRVDRLERQDTHSPSR